MATTIVTKNSSTASAVPTAAQLVQGELAVNVTDKRLYTEDNAGAVVELGTNPSTLTVTGEITANGGIALGDNDKATFGAGDDLQIYHDGSGSYIDDAGTGNLFVRADNLQLRRADGSHLYLAANTGAEVALYHAGNSKLATTATGIDVTGTVTADGLVVSDATGTVGLFNSTAVASTLAINNTHANAWGSNIAFQTGGTAAGYFGSIGGLLGNTDQDLVSYSTAGNGFRIYTNGNNERLRVTSAGNVGIGTSSPNEALHVYNATTNVLANFESGDAKAFISFKDNSTTNTDTVFLGADGNNMAFYAGSASSERMRIDSSGDLLVNTTASGVWGNATQSVNDNGHSLRNDGIHGSAAYKASANVGYVQYLNRTGSDGGIAAFYKNGATVGSIGTAGGDLTVGTGDTGITFEDSADVIHPITQSSGAARDGAIDLGKSAARFKDLYLSGGVSTNTATGLSITADSSNRGILNLSTSTAYQLIGGSYYGYTGYKTGGYHRWFGSDGSEDMRIDSSGNLLVGTTDRLVADGTGTGLVLGGQSDLLHVSRNAGDCAKFNRVTTDGPIVTFAKDGTAIGNISSYGASRLSIGSGDIGLVFAGDFNAIYPSDGGVNSQDNAVDLGLSSVRFDDIYATNGTIQTSDRNEKQDIAELSDAEQRVAVACKGLLRKFRWKDSVAEKGDEARVHFGIIAQDLQDAFAAEGLDAGDYAMFISTTWTDEETNEEKTRMGVRYSELLAFIIAAI